MSVRRILIAEDDANIRRGLVDLFEADGFATTAVEDGSAATEAFGMVRPDLVLLDVMMPGKSGYDVCREIRKVDATVPIIMLTAKGDEIDKVVGLELGADDYVTKPFGVHELRARVNAVFRRVRMGETVGGIDVPEAFMFGAARIDRKRYTAERGVDSFRLTAKEMALIEVFLSRPDEVLGRNDLLNMAWGVDYLGTTRTLDQHVAQLRRKIEEDPGSPRAIVTVHGVGYRYVP